MLEMCRVNTVTTEYFSELTDHTLEEAETLCRWAMCKEGYRDRPLWIYRDCIDLQMWLHEQTILAIRDGGGIVNESLSH